MNEMKLVFECYILKKESWVRFPKTCLLTPYSICCERKEFPKYEIKKVLIIIIIYFIQLNFHSLCGQTHYIFI